MKFPKSERLSSQKLIQEIFSKGKVYFQYPFRILFFETEEKTLIPPTVLFSVPKKNFKRAVDRNWIRRRLKECYRLNKNILKSEGDYYTISSIAVIYIAKEKIEYKDLEKKMKQSLERLLKK